MNSELFTQFLSELHDFKENSLVFNQYKKDAILNNIQVYLTHLESFHPKILLVGEASGYKGCKLTGIPFTSGYVLAHSPCYQQVRPKLIYDKNKSENSATIVYGALESWGIPIFRKLVFWNSFPFHPHNADNLSSNRKPTTNEVEIGKDFLQILNKLFNFEIYIAIGDTASKSLTTLFPNTPILSVRHPSYGGKNQFIEELHHIIEENLIWSKSR